MGGPIHVVTSQGREMVEVMSPRLLSVVVSANGQARTSARRAGMCEARRLTSHDDLLSKLETLSTQ